MSLLLQATSIFIALRSVDTSIYLYHTYDGTGVEFFDCAYAESFWYCRRPTEPMNLTRNEDASACEWNGGIAHSFSDLRSNGTNVSTILHEWKSSIERVEQYARFLRDDSPTDGYLCQCVHPLSFGKNCEYRLLFDKTFQETIDWHRVRKESAPSKMHYYADILCYPTLSCDSGLLCLDWREICDGVQQCMYGYDEENCDLLELNVCNEDEYRCMNGMCIPNECFLDGVFDCLDWSDEMQYMKSEDCSVETASARCDDHVCPPNQWSCGDGQCIPDRLGFQKLKTNPSCASRRNLQFTCEANIAHNDWTRSDGRCFTMSYYATDPIVMNSIEDECEYLFRCLLSVAKHVDCRCDSSASCRAQFEKLCPLSLVPYPKRPVFTPYMIFLYESSRVQNNRLPSMMSVNGTIKCRNFFLQVNRTIPYYSNVTVRQLMNDLCSSRVSNQASWCHNENESTDICQEWNPCMSRTRLSDGLVNCLNGRDETEQTTVCDRRHRFRCSTEQSTCLSVVALGNQNNDCDNRFDEFWLGYKKPLAEMECHDRDTSECFLIRRYLEQSWTSSYRDQIASHHRIRFRSYCDTFWDTATAEDENVTECRQWWSCASNKHRCRSGQCYQRIWELDDQWDCTDGSDEFIRFLGSLTRIQYRAALFNISEDTFHLSAKSCSATESFICLSPQTSHQHFRCLNLSQLGDNIIDCAGAIDERNTVRHCSHSGMLGDYFKCPSDNTCIPYDLHCNDGHRCPNRSDDAHWCSWQEKLDRCRTTRDFVCFSRQCARFGRCDQNVDCLYGEDEYQCPDRFALPSDKLVYRQRKQLQMAIAPRIFELKPFPIYLQKLSQSSSFADTVAQTPVIAAPRKNLWSFTPYECNRGVSVFFGNDTISCFCPPQYYGDKCQFHADRLLVLLSLRLTQPLDVTHHDSNIVVKLLVLFLYHGQTVMTHEFHVRPALEVTTVTKKMIHFLYSHSNTSQQQRRRRYFNRSDILASHPYSVHIEAYEYYNFTRPSLIAVWRYPLQFDYLPVYRFAKVLHLTRSTDDPNPCAKHPCHRNEECHQLMNDPTRYVCLCKANFTGPNCSLAHEQCVSGYCATGALCKPSYRGSLRGGSLSLPYCICLLDRFGDRCDLEHDACRSNPCRNGGTCYPSSQPDQTICLCTDDHYGELCDLRKSSITLTLKINRPYAGAVIQFFDYDPAFLILMLDHQEVYQVLPHLIRYNRNAPEIPPIALVKLHSSFDDRWPDVYLLMIQINVQSVTAQTDISETNLCPHVNTLLTGNSSLFSHRDIEREYRFRTLSVSISPCLPQQLTPALFP